MYEDCDLTWVSAIVYLAGCYYIVVRDCCFEYEYEYHVLEVIPTHAMTDEWVINQREYGRKNL
jgi:hypothetical protein